VNPPGDDVAVKPVIGAPPVGVVGAVQYTVAWPAPGAALTVVGAAGTIDVTPTDAPEAGPVPTALAAVTVKVYVVPLVRPVTVAEDA
jgi:hypothetical protein